MDPKLQEAIQAIKGGDRAGGRRLLIEVLKLDPENELAWLWLASVVEGERQKQALEKVLAINPYNTAAAQRLAEFAAVDVTEPTHDGVSKSRREIPKIFAVLAVVGAVACIAGVIVLSFIISQFTRIRGVVSAPTPVSETGEVVVQPTRRPRVSCSEEEVELYLDELDLLMEEWDDVVVLAGSTSRMSLSPVIKEMQDVRRNGRRIARPECANYLHDMVMVAMDARIDTFISFLSQDSDSIVARKMEGADSVRQAVDEEIAAFREDALAAYLASGTSAAELEEQSDVAQPFERPSGWKDVSFTGAVDLLVSVPSDWRQSSGGGRGQVLLLDSADGSMTVSLSSSSDKFLDELESDSARLFALQTVLETSDYDYYLERNAETGVYALNKGYVVEFSRREDSGDDIEDAISAIIVTPEGDEVIMTTRTTRDEFAQIDLLILEEIYASVRRER